MMRSTFSCLAKRVAEKKVGVSPYGVFLMHQAASLPKETASKLGKPADSKPANLNGMAFERRGRECGKIWKASSPAYRKRCQEVAAAMPNVEVKKRRALGLPRRPPPFARWVRANWSTAPSSLNFEGKTLYLAREFHRVWKKTHSAKA